MHSDHRVESLRDGRDDHAQDRVAQIEITNLDEIVKELAGRIAYCIDEPSAVDAMKSRIHVAQRELHWDVNIQRTCDIYERALARG